MGLRLSGEGVTGLASSCEAYDLSQVRNRYLDSPIRLNTHLFRYFTRSANVNAPNATFTADSIQSGMATLRGGF